MSKSRTLVLAVMAAVGVVAGSGALAWACTAEPMISVAALISPDGTTTAVPKGAKVVLAANSETTVQVVNYADSAPGRVELRWDGLDGQLLGESDGLSVPVRIPAAAPGAHLLTALFRGVDGKVMSKASTPVRIAGNPLLAESSAWSSPAAESHGSTGLPLTLGAGLLSVGLVMAAGAVVVATVRRRAPAKAS